MRKVPTCPRCGGPVHEPSAWSSAWQCGMHGAVHPLRTSHASSAGRLRSLARGAVVPVWLPWPIRGCEVATGLPDGIVRFSHHEFPLWHVQVPERAAFAGEAMGSWLWLILWPATAGVLLVERLELLDLRDPGVEPDLPFGAPSPLLPG